MTEKDVVKTTTFECGCVTSWKVKRLEPTPLTCPVHRATWSRTESDLEAIEAPRLKKDARVEFGPMPRDLWERATVIEDEPQPRVRVRFDFDGKELAVSRDLLRELCV